MEEPLACEDEETCERMQPRPPWALTWIKAPQRSRSDVGIGPGHVAADAAVGVEANLAGRTHPLAHALLAARIVTGLFGLSCAPRGAFAIVVTSS